ncbi:hypothetical protein BVY03_04645 [bacterium K02(2017)]|nr:hypothetical protein BVY03_04645 [bacterium K02(2017)]
MNKKNITYFILFCFVCSFSSCASFWSFFGIEDQDDKSQMTVKEPRIDHAKLLREKEAKINKKCMDYLKEKVDLKKIENPDVRTLQVFVKNELIKDDLSLSKWVSELSQDLFQAHDCRWDSIKFEARLNQESYHYGVSKKADFNLYNIKKISLPEWYRRFEIKKLDNINSIKARFKEARYLGDLTLALKLVDQILEQQIQSLEYKIIRNNILLDQEMYHEAILGYQDLLTWTSDNAIILYNLAYALKAVGRYDAAITIYKKLERVITSQSNKTATINKDDVYLQIVEVYLKNNQIELAKIYFDQVVIQTDYYNILFAIYLRRIDDSKRALTILSQIPQDSEFTPLILYNSILLQLDLKEQPSARESLMQLKLIEPEMAAELAFLKVLDIEPELTPVNTELESELTKESIEEPENEAGEWNESQPLF